MPTRRPHLFALLGAIVALTPTMAIGGSVDARATASIPAPDAPQAPGQTPTALDIAQLKSGLDALAANNIVGAP
ncbi:lytic transglycosylase domain-containing protein, partial [Mesorhizobium sp. CA17]|nr:lytic transglycosylase domain-containing protein [Mesorhizobium sp. CA17]